MKLGQTTDTQDAEGKIIERKNYSGVDKSAIRNTIKSFEGEFFQKPPMYSALKYKGKPLYKYAKKGFDIPVKPRKVHIQSLELLDIHLPFISFRVNCSKGTYIRTLCHDIGAKLKVGAHLYELQRTAIGSFTIDNSIRMEELQEINAKHTDSSQFNISNRGIYTLDSALTWMPELGISQKYVQSAKNGVPIKTKTLQNFSETLKAASGIRIKSSDGHLIAIGRFLADKDLIKMDIVFGGSS
jgi:tRNA pseudouridine55 synthase